MSSLANEMSYQNATSLRDADAEKIYEHDDVVAIGTGGKCFVADLVDEERDYHLRQAIGDILTHGRDADFQQVAKFFPGQGSEIVQREARDVLLEMDDG